MSIRVTTKGKLSRTKRFLNKLLTLETRLKPILNKYGEIGVMKLESVTPRDSGITAGSWDYKIEFGKKRCSIYWTNNSLAGETPIVILIQYGHATRSGTFVEGKDIINPALSDIFNSMRDEVWKEVMRDG